MVKIKVDISSLKKGLVTLDARIETAQWGAILDVANEILRLSQFQVPHDTGRLQNSGHVEPKPKDRAIVGYNTVYAARLHENPQYHFKKGRKGKYLEDPIKENMTVFRGYVADKVREATR
jgi:hypothetical protein